MIVRRKCRREGHKYIVDSDALRELPIIFCDRFFCSGAVVAPWVIDSDPALARELQRMISRQT